MISRFVLHGPLPSKKNMYKKRMRGPGKGLFIPPEVVSQLNNLLLQIPPDLRGAGLLNPDFEIAYSLPHDIKGQHNPWTSDPDGRFTTLLDLFVKVGLLRDDNFNSNNGFKLIHPARVSDLDGLDIDSVQITVYDNGGLMKALRERFLSEQASY